MQDRGGTLQKKAVGIWIRVSTEDQARGESPLHHEKRARLYAESKEWNVAEVYHLEGVSGKSVAAHPEAQRMLADMRSGRITGLIFSKLARLARNTKELLEFSEEFRAAGADLISLQESIDTSSPAGRLFYTMIAAMAQWEREEIADRVKASVPIRAKLGKPLSGSVPYGYMQKDGKVVPHPEQAPVRRLMYELFMESRRKKAVARVLNERGYRTPNGLRWSYTAINRLLRDPTAKGVYRSNFTMKNAEGKIVQKPESEWVLHQIEPIVSEELWDQVNAILSDQKDHLKKPGRSAVHLFSGLTYCAKGHKMYVPSRNPPQYRCWECGAKIPAADLEAIYHEELRGFLFSDEQVAAQLELLDTTAADKDERVKHLERERERLLKDQDALFELYKAGGVNPAGFATRNRPMETRLGELADLIPTEQASADLLRINRLNSAQVLGEARDLHSRWEGLERAEKRVVVETITRAITIGKEEVHIDLHYIPRLNPPASPGPGNTGGASRRPKNQTKSKTSIHSGNALKKVSGSLGLVRGP
ncbi:MAG: recombinase family protein [Alphaproteobacteria bacterium]|nr:recombinase family protein [Alphaproteobacteria bacterium]